MSAWRLGVALVFVWQATAHAAIDDDVDGGAGAGLVGAAAPRPAAVPSDEPTVAAKVDRARAQIGEVITVTITTVAPATVAVNLPTNLDLGPFHLLQRDQHESDLGAARMRRQFTLKVSAFEPGDLVLPAVALTYLGKGGTVRRVSTEPLDVHITSVLANEPEPELKGNAAAVQVYEEQHWPLFVAGGLLVAGLGILIGIRVARMLRARMVDRPVPPPRPPHEVAFEKLDRLGARGFEEGADQRPFYFEVSEVIREYLGARFGFESLELTTDELMSTLRKRAARSLDLAETETWLSEADLVKFAKVSPSAAEARGALETAIRIVSSTRPREPAPAAAAVDVAPAVKDGQESTRV